MLNKLVDSKDPEQYLQRVFETCSFERNKKGLLFGFGSYLNIRDLRYLV